jgi:hypothetical protein
VPVSITASSNVDNGRVLVSVDDIRVLGVALPASTRNTVQQSIQAQVDAALESRHVRVKAVSIDGGELVMWLF